MSTQQTFKRRGLLSGAAGAAVAAVFVRGTPRAAALSGTGDQGALVLGSNRFLVAGSNAGNTPNISSVATVVEASPNFGNFINANINHVFKVDATPASGRINGIVALGTDGGSGLVGVGGAGTATNNPGVGVLGFAGGVVSSSPVGNTGILGQGGLFPGVTGRGSPGISGQANSDGDGVSGVASNGTGVQGVSSTGLGASFSGGLAPMHLAPATTGTSSPTTGTHRAGEFYVAANGALFYCTTGGTPGTWVALTAPAFVTLPTPERFVDTRLDLGGVQGPVPGQTTHTFQMTGRNGQSGNTALRIPDAATTIVGNLTVIGGAGISAGSFVTLWPGGPQPTVSNINLFPGAVVANSFVVGLSASAGHGNVTVFNQPQCDYILDVTGYYV